MGALIKAERQLRLGLSQVGGCFGGVQNADNCGVHSQMT